MRALVHHTQEVDVRFMGQLPTMPAAGQVLPGRADPMTVPDSHEVTGQSISPPFPSQMHRAVFGMGCFWGAERGFWELSGVYSTAVGYAGGFTPNPTYREVCGGLTGHAEVVLVVFDPSRITYDELLRQFWEGHDPTQGMRQGNDVGTQYRSVIHHLDDEQAESAKLSKQLYQRQLEKAALGEITTEVVTAPPFFYAEAYHQQYLAKNPQGYCGHGGTGVSCPVGATV